MRFGKNFSAVAVVGGASLGLNELVVEKIKENGGKLGIQA